jgi:hypothetical protein
MIRQPINHEYIGYECVLCGKKIEESERQKIIQLKCFQTWCMLCIVKKYPNDKHLLQYANHQNENVLIRFK